MPDRHDDIMLLLGELRGDSKGILKHLETLNSKVAAHEKRLNETDGFVNKAIGAMSLAMLIIPAAISTLIKKVGFN